MSAYSEYFLKTNRDILQYETIEISHPSLTHTYRVVRNAVNGITAKLETGVVVPFIYYPMKATSLGTRDDLDQGIRISLGDLGEVLPREIDRIQIDDTFGIKPEVAYRAFRSDQLMVGPMVGPLRLEVTNFTFAKEGSTFEAKAPSLNMNLTGEAYTLTRFPMLRGFL